MGELVRQLAENLAEVRGRVAAAAQRSGRGESDITLVAVTKYVSSDVAAALVGLGCLDLGESRPQELWSKAATLADAPVRWHLIGHLQRNKLRRTLPLVHLMHSADSRRLLAAVDEEAAIAGLTARVLIDVNISGDITKTGVAPSELPALLAQANTWKHVELCGLMAMASLEGDESESRRDFARLRTLRDELVANSAGLRLNELSMGMSGDFEVAIEEGATIVRVGSALFAGLDV